MMSLTVSQHVYEIDYKRLFFNCKTAMLLNAENHSCCNRKNNDANDNANEYCCCQHQNT